MQKVTVGLYRHFKGDYYFIQNIVKDCSSVTEKVYAQYFNVLHPEYGFFIRDIEEWFDEYSSGDKISDRLDNATGQIHRFEKVKSLRNALVNFSTASLISELSIREDSPFQNLDVEGLNNQVASVDYIVGTEIRDNDVVYVDTLKAYDTKEEALSSYRKTPNKKRLDVFKRVFVRLDR